MHLRMINEAYLNVTSTKFCIELANFNVAKLLYVKLKKEKIIHLTAQNYTRVNFTICFTNRKEIFPLLGVPNV